MESYENVFITLGIISIASFLGSIIVVPFIIANLPYDYFTRPAKPLGDLGPLRIATRVLKNVLGLLFLLSGFVMLFIPGQGILAILLGLSLIDFPGKQRLQIRILRSARVQKLVQWCRRKAGRQPLQIPES